MNENSSQNQVLSLLFERLSSTLLLSDKNDALREIKVINFK